MQFLEEIILYWYVIVWLLYDIMFFDTLGLVLDIVYDGSLLLLSVIECRPNCQLI